MRKNLLELVKCICCGSESLKVLSEQEDEIVSGLIFCQGCSHAHPIVHGIPCFLPREIWDEEITTAYTMLSEKFLSQLGESV